MNLPSATNLELTLLSLLSVDIPIDALANQDDSPATGGNSTGGASGVSVRLLSMPNNEARSHSLFPPDPHYSAGSGPQKSRQNRYCWFAHPTYFSGKALLGADLRFNFSRSRRDVQLRDCNQ